jgi:hypothetical protein
MRAGSNIFTMIKLPNPTTVIQVDIQTSLVGSTSLLEMRHSHVCGLYMVQCDENFSEGTMATAYPTWRVVYESIDKHGVLDKHCKMRLHQRGKAAAASIERVH